MFENKKIHFIGIGGISMSGIAEILHEKGAIITGSDMQEGKTISKLKEKGFENTHIMNPHGLHHEDHFTTAFDLAKITAYALSNQTFREIKRYNRSNILY